MEEQEEQGQEGHQYRVDVTVEDPFVRTDQGYIPSVSQDVRTDPALQQSVDPVPPTPVWRQTSAAPTSAPQYLQYFGSRSQRPLHPQRRVGINLETALAPKNVTVAGQEPTVLIGHFLSKMLEFITFTAGDLVGQLG